jgi:hypothetical protein
MFDVKMTIACLLVLFSLAAGILFVIDRLTLRKTLSAEERKAAIDTRTERWHRRWNSFFFVMAFIVLFVNAFNLGHESIGWRVGWFVIAAFVVLGYLSKNKNPEG